jgi:hypothetical protein
MTDYRLEDPLLAALRDARPDDHEVDSAHVSAEASELFARIVAIDRNSASADRSHRQGGRSKSIRRHRLAVLAATALIIAGAVGGITFGLWPGSPTGTDSAAASVLTKAAREIATQPALPALRVGQYYYVRRVTLNPCTFPVYGTGGHITSVTYLDAHTTQMWVAVDNSGEERITSDPGGHFLTSQDRAAWRAAGSPSLFNCNSAFDAHIPPNSGGLTSLPTSLPTDPSKLESLIAAGRVNAKGDVSASATRCPVQSGDRDSKVPPGDVCSVADQFFIAADLLFYPDGQAKLGAALYRVLAQLPGVIVIGHRTDAFGRTGTAIEDPSSGQVFVLDPITGILLEEQVLATSQNASQGFSRTFRVRLGTVLSTATLGPVSVVNDLGNLPS